MRVFVNHLSNYGNTTDVDLTISRHMSRLHHHVPIDVEFNHARIQPLLIRASRRLSVTRFARWAQRLPTHLIAVPASQVAGFDIAYHFHIAPHYWGFGKIPPSVLRTHWLTDRVLHASGVPDAAAFRRRNAEAQRRYDACITSTRSSIQLFRNVLDGVVENVYYCPFFLPEVVALDQQRFAEKCKEKTVRVLFVGADGLRKGVNILVAALAMLESHVCRKLHVDIVTASAIDVAPLKHISCTWHTRLPHASVLQLMARAHVFCMPTLHDTYGVVFVEAMSQGCAVIADDDLPRLELVRGTGAGICVDPTEVKAPAAVASALTHLVENVDTRIAYMRQAYKTFTSEFAADVVARRHEEIFRDVIARGRRSDAPRGL